MSMERLTPFLGPRLQQARRSAKLTQEQLAEKSGLTANFIAHLERGSRQPSIHSLVAVCRVLDVPVGALLSDPGAGEEAMKESPEFRRLCRLIKRLPPSRYGVLAEMAAAMLKPSPN